MDLPSEGQERGSDFLVEEDWSPTGERREAYFFSRGLMAKSLLRLGMPAGDGLQVASSIQEDLENRSVERISLSLIHI